MAELGWSWGSRATACERKKPYSTVERARRAAYKLGTPFICLYRCEYCGRIHIGRDLWLGFPRVGGRKRPSRKKHKHDSVDSPD